MMLIFKSYKEHRIRLSPGKNDGGWHIDVRLDDADLAMPATLYASQQEAVRAGMDAVRRAVDGDSDAEDKPAARRHGPGQGNARACFAPECGP
jgi:hypothetical protein